MRERDNRGQRRKNILNRDIKQSYIIMINAEFTKSYNK